MLLVYVTESIGSSKWCKGKREQAFWRWEVWRGVIAIWTCFTSSTKHAFICQNTFNMPFKQWCVLSETGMVFFILLMRLAFVITFLCYALPHSLPDELLISKWFCLMAYAQWSCFFILLMRLAFVITFLWYALPHSLPE